MNRWACCVSWLHRQQYLTMPGLYIFWDAIVLGACIDCGIEMLYFVNPFQ